jgi:hypothetical protein
VGGEAVVAAGRWSAARLGDVAVFAEGATPEMADAVAKVAQPLSLWSGVRMGETRFVSLPRTWRPPAALGGEGLAGLRQAVDPEEWWVKKKGGPPPDLPEYATVLGAEGLANAAWTGRGGASASGRAWLWAFGRAFALDVLDPKEAAPWREWLQTCARPREGMRPALSPEVAATGAWREISMRCSGPMIVGPMLDDRLGADMARLVRREVLSGPRVDFAALRAAVVARDPSAAGWADRWLGGGNPVRLRLGWRATAAVAGAHVHGFVEADSDLAGAPVRVRLRRGGLVVDVTLRGDGERVPIDVDVPFEPTRVEVDPDRRMLREPMVVTVDG